ncbi:MAG: PAS/PAC sensor hybrid histidine kinase [Gallionellaceae bacterium]|nr:MAG: PAS/PAC sensor hybrid histidine kinase [Gallionellaceae bacterium]
MPTEPESPTYPILDEIAVPEYVLANWQLTVDLLAELAEVPAALIMRVHAREIEVLVSSRTPGNTSRSAGEVPPDMGRYCETVVRTRKMLLVPGAGKDPGRGQDIAPGRFSYCGMPLAWPTGEIFGTLCVLDEQGHAFHHLIHPVMERFCESIQHNLTSLYQASLAHSQRDETETALRRRETESQRYLDIIQTLIVALDAEGRITLINRAGQTLLGYTEAELLGRNWFGTCLPQPEGMDSVYPVFQRIMAGKLEAFSRYENEVLCRDGSRRLIGWHNSTLENEAGRITSTISSGEDITERKRMEKELERHRNHLEELVQDRTHELETANLELESFAYSVSHDLRVPLRAIDGFSQRLLKRSGDTLDDEGRRLLKVVRDNTGRMGQLIDDILAFSRAGRQEMRASEIDMGKLAHDVWQDFEALLGDRKVRLDIGALPGVRGDLAMLRQVFANLLSNAVKFTSKIENALIEIGSSRQDGECV